MKKRHTTASLGLPPLTIDPSLNQYAGKILFPEKHAEMEATLARVGLPKREGAPTTNAKTSARPVKPASPRPKKAA